MKTRFVHVDFFFQKEAYNSIAVQKPVAVALIGGKELFLFQLPLEHTAFSQNIFTIVLSQMSQFFAHKLTIQIIYFLRVTVYPQR